MNFVQIIKDGEAIRSGELRRGEFAIIIEDGIKNHLILCIQDASFENPAQCISITNPGIDLTRQFECKKLCSGTKLEMTIM